MEGSCDLELGLRLAGAYHEANHRSRAEAPTASGQMQQEHLTIIYKGEVCIYENVSETQARAIMSLAGSGERPPRLSGVNTVKELTVSTKNLLDPRPKSCEGTALVMPTERCSNATSALPMKRSLQRFLQKRKLRMQKSSASPY